MSLFKRNKTEKPKRGRPAKNTSKEVEAVCEKSSTELITKQELTLNFHPKHIKEQIEAIKMQTLKLEQMYDYLLDNLKPN